MGPDIPNADKTSSSIASRIGYNLLQQNYIVRGTTRSKNSADALLEGAYAPYAQNVQMVQVADMTIDGAFDEAVKGLMGFSFAIGIPLI